MGARLWATGAFLFEGMFPPSLSADYGLCMDHDVVVSVLICVDRLGVRIAVIDIWMKER